MAKTATTRYDVSEHLRTPEEMAAYLEASLEHANGDAAFIAKALGDIARAKGMSQVARDAGLSRESLYKALSGERSPSFDTILKVVSALGLKLHAEAIAACSVTQQTASAGIAPRAPDPFIGRCNCRSSGPGVKFSHFLNGRMLGHRSRAISLNKVFPIPQTGGYRESPLRLS